MTADYDVVRPTEVADELGVSPKALRDFLRHEFPRAEEDIGDDWLLTPEHIAAARARFGRREQRRGMTEFAAIAKAVLESGQVDLDDGELDYKRDVARRMVAARTECEAAQTGWDDVVLRSLRSGNNLVSSFTYIKFKDALQANLGSGREALLALWRAEGESASVADFHRYLGDADAGLSPGGALELASSLLLGVADVAPFKAQALRRFADRVGAPLVADTSDVAARWSEFLTLLDEARIALESEQIQVRDRVEVQSIVWVVSQWTAEDIAGGDLLRRVRDWRGETVHYERKNRVDQGSEDAAWAILRAGLLQLDSPVVGGPSVWNADNAQELVQRIFDDALVGADQSFEEKIQIQLRDAESEVIQLVAEIQLIRQLVTGGIGIRGASKALALYAGMADETWEMPDWLRQAFTGHVFGGGNRFNQDQWLHIVQTARFAADWFGQDPDERERLLSEPWALLDFLEESGGSEAAEKHMRMALGYVAWPNYFHPIISSTHIKQIRAAFPDVIAGVRGHRNADIQRDLFDIDRTLEKRHGGPVNFYRSPYVEYWRGGEGPQPLPDEVSGWGFAETARRLADGLHMESDALARIGRVLEQRRQIVFYGPPGTGKTYVARKLASALAGEDADGAIRLVQFHPSYSYEDFFEGFRPTASDGGAGFSLQSGPLRKLAANAKDNPDQPHFLIIDEMNRGNLAKVFGELYFLLEYRDEEVFLQYSPTVPFTLPENLFIIGTMNTTDRSISLVDAAIRRRFAFIEFHPHVSPVEGVLERYLEANGFDAHVASYLSTLNGLIGERDLQIGPSYFMRPQVHESGGLEDVWDFDILPLLYEHFHGRKDVSDVRREFSLDVIRGGAVHGGDE